MGTRSGAKSTSRTGRVRALGNSARIATARVKPTSPTPNYHALFNKSLKRQLRREKRRDIEARIAQIRAEKSGAIREKNKAQAQDERARVRAEREAAARRR